MPRNVKFGGIDVEGVPDYITDDEVQKMMSGATSAFAPSRQELLERALRQIEPEGEVDPTRELDWPFTRFKAGRPTREMILEKALTLLNNVPGLTEQDIAVVTDPRSVGLRDPDLKSILVRPPGGSGKWIEMDSPDLVRLSDFTEAISPILSAEGMMSVGGWMLANRLGFGWLFRSAAAGGGATLGRLADSEVDRAVGVEQTGRAGAAVEALTAGAAGAAGSVVGEGITAPLRFIRPPPIMPRELAELAGDVEALNVRMRSQGVLSEGDLIIGPTRYDVSPVGRTLAGQATVTERGAVFQVDRAHRILNLIEQRAKNLEQLSHGQAPGTLSIRALSDITDKWEQDLTAAAAAPLRGSYANAGRATEAGLHAFEKYRGELIDKLYAEVRRMAFDQNVLFDTAQAKVAVRRLMLGEVGLSTKAKMGYSSTMQVAPPLRREMQRFVDFPDQVGNISLDIKGTQRITTSGVDQLRTIRTNVYNMIGKFSDPRQDAIMYRFIDEITKVIENPVGGNKAFVGALRRAEGVYQSTQRTLDALHIREIVKANKGNPEQIGRTLIDSQRPEQAGLVRAMFKAGERGGLPPTAWEDVKQGYFTRILEDVNKIPGEIARWRRMPGGGRFMISDTEEDLLRTWVHGVRAQHSGPIGKLVEEAQPLGRQAFESLVTGVGEDTLRRLVADAGGRNSPLVRGMRYALYKHLLDGAVDMRLGPAVLRRDIFLKRVAALRQSGRAEIVLDAQELADLGTLERLVSIIPTTGVGERLLTAQIGQSLGSLATLNIPRFIAGIPRYTQNYVTALIASSPRARRYFNKHAARMVAGKKGGAAWFRPLSVALSIALKEHHNTAVEWFGPNAEPDAPAVQLGPRELEELQQGQ